MTSSAAPSYSPSPRWPYLLLALPGSLLPWVWLLQFLLSPAASVGEFFHLAFANPVASALSVDLIISTLVFWVFAFQQLRQAQQLRQIWLYKALTLGIGLSCALPLFLANRPSDSAAR